MSKNKFTRLSQNLKIQREERGLTQTDLAQALGFSIASIRQWEGGHTLPRKKNQGKLEAFFNLDPGYLTDHQPPSDQVVGRLVPGHKTSEYLGKNTRRYRQARGWTLEDLAQAIGLSISFVSDWEHGRSPALAENAERISQALEVPLSQLSVKDRKLPRVSKEISPQEAAYRKNLGKKIKKLRQARGWNKAQLARQAQVAPLSITQWEEGRVTIRPPYLRKLAQALGVRPEDLSGQKPQPLPQDSARVLKALREERGLSQKRLGELADVSSSAIFTWEQGTFRPRRINRMKLEDFFGQKLRDWPSSAQEEEA